MRNLFLFLFKRFSRPFWDRGIYYKLPFIHKVYCSIYHSLSSKGIIIFNINGLKIYVEGKSDIARLLGIKGSYEEETTTLLTEILKEGMTVLDIGANIGYYSLLASRLVGDKGKVFAFEPFPQSFLLLQKNIEANGFKNIIPVAKAVSNQCGRQKLFLASDPGQHTLGGKGNSRFIEVDVTTVDEFVREQNISVDLVKMDVEGLEKEVLLGMEKTISNSKNIEVLFESWDESYLIECKKVLQSYGLVIDDKVRDLMNYRAKSTG